VYPAAGLVDYFQGDRLAVINKSELDGVGRGAGSRRAGDPGDPVGSGGSALVISESIGEVLGRVEVRPVARD
jgi:hypothetical protein